LINFHLALSNPHLVTHPAEKALHKLAFKLARSFIGTRPTNACERKRKTLEGIFSSFISPARSGATGGDATQVKLDSASMTPYNIH